MRVHSPRSEGVRTWRLVLRLAVIVMAVAATLTACGGNGSNGDVVTLTEEDYYSVDRPQGAGIQWLFDEYERTHPNVRIQRTIIDPGTLTTTLIGQAHANLLPDIAIIDNPDMPAFIATHKLHALDGSLKQWHLSNSYISGAREVTRGRDGKTYGLLIGTNTLAIVYNKAMFVAAGISRPPHTWAEFRADAKKLATRRHAAFTFGAGHGGCAAWQFNPWQWSAGGRDADLASPGNVRALAFWKSLVDSGLAKRNVVNQCQDDTAEKFLKGRVAMMENGPWEFPRLNAAKFEWGIFPIPVPTERARLIVPLGGEVWTLPKTGHDRASRAAADFLRWTQSTSVLTRFNEKIGYIPVQSRLWPAVEGYNPMMTPFTESLNNARGRTTSVGEKYPVWSTALAAAITQVLHDGRSPQAALDAAQRIVARNF